MPSPLAHGTVGYLIYQISQTEHPEKTRGLRLPRLLFMFVVIFFSLIPDLDSILGVVFEDIARFHNNWTHGILTSFVISGLAGLLIRWILKLDGWYWAKITWLSYSLHIFMDFFTHGRGLMLLWPFSLDRFEAPVKFFFGLRYSEGIISSLHIWTLVNEIIFVAVMFSLYQAYKEYRAKLRTTRQPKEQAVEEGGDRLLLSSE